MTCLAEVIAVGPARVSEMLAILDRWTRAADLQPSEISYVTSTRARSPLRFTADGDPETERAFRMQWTAPQLSDAARRRLAERRSAPPDLVVVSAIREWTCAECGDSSYGGDLLIMEADRPLCLCCADLDHLVFLGAGDAALTRRAKKASTLSAVADHTCARGSGRVGRSAAGRELDDDAVLLAVVASARHEDTGYDRLLMSGVERADARERVRADIDRVLDAWRSR